MTDTNQLPPLPPLQPGDSHMESLIEAAIQGHASTREAMRWLVRQLMPMQARAQVQGEPVGMVQVGWQQRYICPEEGPSSWQDTCSATAAILAKKANHEVRATYAFSTTPQPARAQVQGEAATVAVDHFDNAPHTELTSRIHPPVEIGTKLYTTPQPAQATQAEVTDLTIERVFLDHGLVTTKRSMRAARAILALRPAAVPMTYGQIKAEFQRKQDELSERGASANCPTDLADFTIGVRYAEAHHGITAQAKKEGV